MINICGGPPRRRQCPAVSWPSDEAVRAGRFGVCVIEEHETTRGVATLYRRHRDEHGYEWWSTHVIPPESVVYDS